MMSGSAKRVHDKASPADKHVDTASTMCAADLVDKAVVVLLALFAFLLCVFPLGDFDFWWHLKTGELILETGSFPRTDWYLFTDSDRPWVDMHWGFQVMIALVHAAGGVDAVVIVKALAVALAVAIGFATGGRDLPAALRVLLWLAPVVLISGRAFVRPEFATLVLLAACLLVAFNAERKPRWIWAIPALHLLWVNTHALFVLGMVVGGCFVIDYVLRRFANGRFGLEKTADQLPTKHVVICAALGTVVLLANPYLLEGVLFPFVLYRKFGAEQAFYSARISEFKQPITFAREHGLTNMYLIAQLVTALLAVASFVVQGVVRRTWSPLRVLLFVGFAHLAWEATRNAAIFALVSGVVTTANLGDAWRGWSLQPHERKFFGGVLGAALVVACFAVVTGAWGRSVGEGRVFGLGEVEGRFAHDAALFVAQPGFPQRAVVAHIGQAAVFTYHNGPDRKVLIDPRLEVVSRETFELYEAIGAKMAVGDTSWHHDVRDDEGRLPVVLLDARQAQPAVLGLLRTRGWRLVYADTTAAVFLPSDVANRLRLNRADPRPLIPPDILERLQRGQP